MIPTFDQLLAACRSSNREQQYAAMLALSQHYPDATSKVFLELLHSPDVTIRVRAANLLGKVGKEHPGVVSALIKALEDTAYLVRAEAIKALAKLNYASVSEYAVQLLYNDPHWSARSIAAEVIGYLNDATILPQLEEVLQRERSPAVRASVVRTIGLIAQPAYELALERYLSTDTAPAVQRELLAACYRLGNRLKLRPLLALLEDSTKDSALGILFTIHYLVTYRPPSSLHEDKELIRRSVIKFSLRLPTYAQEAQFLLDNL